MIAGVASTIALFFGLVVASSVAASLFAPPEIRSLPFGKMMQAARNWPLLENLVPVCWSMGMGTGGFVSARRYSGSWVIASGIVELLFFLAWGVPSSLLVPRMAFPYRVAIGLLIPAALVGGLLGRSRAT